MKKSDQLKQERQSLKDAQITLTEKAESESRDFSPEEATAFDKRHAEIEAMNATVTRAENAEALQLEKAERDAIPVDLSEEKRKKDKPSGEDSEKREKAKIMAKFSMKRALEAQLDQRALDGVEAEVNAMAKEELRSQGLEVPRRGINIPNEMMFRADSHTVTQDGGAFGGNLVREEVGEMLPTFVDRLSIEDLGVTVKRGLIGDYPLVRGSEFTFENLAETANTTPQKQEWDKRIMKPKRTAMETAISNQLLIQSEWNVETDIRNRITTALNKRLMLDMLNGDGVAPNTLGLLNDPEVAFVYAGAEGKLTLAKINELEGAVDDENIPNGNPIFLIHKKLGAIAKSIPLDAGSGVFLMNMRNELYGTRTVRTSLLPVLTGTADNYPVVYGDMANVYAGFWGGMNLVVDPYTKAGSNEVRMIVNLHRDIMAANPQGFAINKKITL